MKLKLAIMAACGIVGGAAAWIDQPAAAAPMLRDVGARVQEAPQDEARVQELRAELERLEKRRAEIRAELRDLGAARRDLGARRWPRLDHDVFAELQRTMESLRENLEHHAVAPPQLRLKLRAPGLDGQAFAAEQGKSVAIRVGPDGRVFVTVTETGEDGAVQEQTYEAESMEAFREEHPELAEKFGIGDGLRLFRFGEDGQDFELGFGLDFGGNDALRRLMEPFARGHAPRGPVPPALAPLLSSGERLGVHVQAAPGARGLALGFAEGEGLQVLRVEEGSLAQRLGVRAGDVVVSIDGRRIAGVDDVAGALRDLRPDDEVRVEVEREGAGIIMLRAKKTEVLRETKRI